MKKLLKLRRIVFSLFASALAYGLFSALTFVSGSRSGSGFWRTPAILLQVHAADTSPASQDLTLQSGEGAVERTYSVNGSDYVIYMNDEEDLLSDEEEEDLLLDMLPITQYGNVAFMTSRIGSSSYVEATGDIYHQLFGTSSGTIFMIDMNHRQLIIFSDGAVYKVITKNYADTITDNIYRMAKRGDYYECAAEAYSEIATLLNGYKIAQPMKHITNAMLAVILSALILYFIARRSARQRSARSDEVLSVLGASCSFTDANLEFTHQNRVYNPHESDSGGGGGFSGGGGGGGSSGGGGSHGF